MPEDSLEQWYKRAEKKAPYYLFSSGPQDRDWILKHYGQDCMKYWIIWRETAKGKTKTKLGIAEDAMDVRYGFDTLAVLTGKLVTGLWQASSGIVSIDQLNAMMDVANDRIKLPAFDIRSLKYVQW